MATPCDILDSLSVLGDVLQLSLSVRGAFLLPGASLADEGSSGRHRSHVHPKGERKTEVISAKKTAATVKEYASAKTAITKISEHIVVCCLAGGRNVILTLLTVLDLILHSQNVSRTKM